MGGSGAGVWGILFGLSGLAAVVAAVAVAWLLEQREDRDERPVQWLTFVRDEDLPPK